MLMENELTKIPNKFIVSVGDDLNCEIIKIVEVDVIHMFWLTFTIMKFLEIIDRFGDLKAYNVIRNKILEYVSMMKEYRDNFIYGIFLTKEVNKVENWIRIHMYGYKCKNIDEMIAVSNLDFVDGLYIFKRDGWIKFRLTEKCGVI